jgi:hypothetical protein
MMVILNGRKCWITKKNLLRFRFLSKLCFKVKIDAQLKKLVGAKVFVLGPKTFFCILLIHQQQKNYKFFGEIC